MTTATTTQHAERRPRLTTVRRCRAFTPWLALPDPSHRLSTHKPHKPQFSGQPGSAARGTALDGSPESAGLQDGCDPARLVLSSYFHDGVSGTHMLRHVPGGYRVGISGPASRVKPSAKLSPTVPRPCS
ncbi:hypothetical protein PR202_gb21192 [Eleusine coracana subsp. coracana]|uniref:Uncharacterized protein n=1 Tax=Eleusine coracana subsp. coracana TaxID=191504 RepID=A0AAV5FCH4_ELECO|nr:hypothetical protein PR202_gb21192 [Eleusine coracana subsp. coracana]